MMYSSAYPEEGFAPTLAVLGSGGGSGTASNNCQHPTKDAACLIVDDELASGIKNGYSFDIKTNGIHPANDFTATAVPQASGLSGRCSFALGASSDVGMVTPDGSLGRFQMSNGGCGP
jgi:hypothetical protein